jgi:hypothetical protein
MYSSPLPCYLVLPTPKYSPQHPILENPKPSYSRIENFLTETAYLKLLIVLLFNIANSENVNIRKQAETLFKYDFFRIHFHLRRRTTNKSKISDKALGIRTQRIQNRNLKCCSCVSFFDMNNRDPTHESIFSYSRTYKYVGKCYEIL